MFSGTLLLPLFSFGFSLFFGGVDPSPLRGINPVSKADFGTTFLFLLRFLSLDAPRDLSLPGDLFELSLCSGSFEPRSVPLPSKWFWCCLIDLFVLFGVFTMDSGNNSLSVGGSGDLSFPGGVFSRGSFSISVVLGLQTGETAKELVATRRFSFSFSGEASCVSDSEDGELIRTASLQGIFDTASFFSLRLGFVVLHFSSFGVILGNFLPSCFFSTETEIIASTSFS